MKNSRCDDLITMGAFFEDSYPVHALLRLADLSFSKKAVFATPTSFKASQIDVGVSRSLILTFALKPTPKLVWSYPLPPSTIVECMDVHTVGDEEKRFVVGLTDGRKHKLVLIDRKGETSNVSEINVNGKIVGVKFAGHGHGNIIFVCMHNGATKLYRKSVEGKLQEVSELSGAKGSKVIFNCFVAEKELGNEHELLITVECHGKEWAYRMISLTETRLLEVHQVLVPGQKDCIFAYNCGQLFCLNISTKEISLLDIPSFSIVKTISVAPLIQQKTPLEAISLQVPAQNRLILGVKGTISLISFSFECLLDSFNMKGDIYLGLVVPTQGQRTFILFLHFNSDKSTTKIHMMNANVGRGTVAECLGKSMHRNEAVVSQGIPFILDEDLTESSKIGANEFGAVLDKLRELRSQKLVEKWERVAVPFMKNELWESITKALNKTKKHKTYPYSAFDIDTDRLLDPSFVEQIISIIVGGDEFVLDPEFLPEHTVVYLLTHPLFPIKYTHGLTEELAKLGNEDLLKQALITCPNLPIDHLCRQLLDSDTGVFAESASRLVAEKSILEITSSFKRVLQEMNSSQGLDTVLNRLLEWDSNKKWILVQAIIDVGGLLNWPASTVDSLESIIARRITSLTTNSYNLTLVGQALLLAQPSKKSKKTKKTAKANDIIESNGFQQQQLDSILAMNDLSSKKVKDEALKLSQKVPSYSVEKLVL